MSSSRRALTALLAGSIAARPMGSLDGADEETARAVAQESYRQLRARFGTADYPAQEEDAYIGAFLVGARTLGRWFPTTR